MNIVLISLSISFLLLVWLNTNVFAIYLRKSKLYKLLPNVFLLRGIRYYCESVSDTTLLEYCKRVYKDNFLIELLSCSICLSFWAGLIVGFFVGLQYTLVIAALSLIFYFIMAILFEKTH